MATLLSKNVRFLLAFVVGGIALNFMLAPAWSGSIARAQDSTAKFDPSVRPTFSEPVTLASKDGVLEVRLTAHQGHANLDTVAVPVKNFLLFAYQVIRGTASNGEMSVTIYTPRRPCKCSRGRR